MNASSEGAAKAYPLPGVDRKADDEVTVWEMEKRLAAARKEIRELKDDVVEYQNKVKRLERYIDAQRKDSAHG